MAVDDLNEGVGENAGGHETPGQNGARVPFRIVLASILGLWLCYFLLTSLRAELLDQLLDLGFAGQLMWRRALASLAGVAITLALWLILRLFDEKPLWVKIAAALVLSLPGAVSIAQANFLLFLDMHDPIAARLDDMQNTGIGSGDDGAILLDLPGVWRENEPAGMREARPGAVEMGPVEDGWITLIELSFSRYFLMLAWCALYLALQTGEKTRAAERRESRFRRAAKAAELRSLRYQVNPHFLFNTLNSLSALVLTGRTGDAERMIQTLSTFYRHSLAGDSTADVPLASEFRLQQLYLDIEAVRFPNRLRTHYVLPAGLEDVLIPGMLLQPLVENSVKHAVSASCTAVTITLAAREEYGRIVVTIADDCGGGPKADADGGVGSGSERSGRASALGKAHGHGIGLANVRQRLEARFGRAASMVSGPTPEGYVTQLRMPIVRTERQERHG